MALLYMCATRTKPPVAVAVPICSSQALPSVRLLQATFNPKILVFGILNPKPSSAESLQKGVEDRQTLLEKGEAN